MPGLDDAHDLIPAALAATIPKLYAAEKEKDPTAHLRWFTPDAHWTWWILEYDPDERLAFGLVRGHDTELGYVALAEVEAVRGTLGLRVERDLNFKPTPLSQCVRADDASPPRSPERGLS